MSLTKPETLNRAWPNHGPRRNKDVNPEQNSGYVAPIVHNENLAKEVSLRLDVSGEMNHLHIREIPSDSLDSNTRRPILHGNSVNGREDFEQAELNGKVSRIHALGNKLPGFLACMQKDLRRASMSALQRRAGNTADDHNYFGRTGANGSVTTPAGWSTPAKANNIVPVCMHPGTGIPSSALIPMGAFGVTAIRADKWLSGSSISIAPKDLVQMMLTGSVSLNSYQTADVLSFVSLADYDGGTNVGSVGNVTTMTSAATSTPISGGAADPTTNALTSEGFRTQLDYVALNMVYSSFADYLIDNKSALDKLLINGEILSTEFMGFFERGFKSHFWQRFSTEELFVMIDLIQLGMAVRRGTWQQNLHQYAASAGVKHNDKAIGGLELPGNASGSTNFGLSFSGTYSPFYLKLNDVSYTSGIAAGSGTYTEWMTPGLQKYVDETLVMPTDVDATRSGMYKEDLMTGLHIIFAEASRELGSAFGTQAKSWMSFFDANAGGFKEGGIANLKTEESRINTDALKTAWNLGFDNVRDVAGSLGSGPTSQLKHTLSSFTTRGGIIDNNELSRHLEDIREMSGTEFLLANEWDSGLRRVGMSMDNGMLHRIRSNGDEATLSLDLSMEARAILTSYQVEFAGGSALIKKSHADYESGTSLPAVQRLCLAWTSTPEGWHVYGDNVVHMIGHQDPGTWSTLRTAQNTLANKIDGVGRGYGHIVTADGYLVNPDRFGSVSGSTVTVDPGSGGARTLIPTMSRMYLDIAGDGWFSTLLMELTKVYTKWDKFSSKVPFKSDLSVGGTAGVNLMASVTKDMGESVIQNNLRSLLHAPSRSSPGNDWELKSLRVDRKLADPILHKLPGRFDTSDVGMDRMAFALLFGEDPMDVIMGHKMLEIILYQQGALTSFDRTTQHADWNGFYAHRPQNKIDFYIDGFSNVRTIYIDGSANDLDGIPQLYRITPMLNTSITTDGTKTNADPVLACRSAAPNLAAYSLMTTAMKYDFELEEAVPAFALINAGHCVPGMRVVYDAFASLQIDAVGSATNCPNRMFGTRDTLATAGTILGSDQDGSALTGWSGSPTEVITTVSAFRDVYQIAERPSSAVTSSTVPHFDTALYLEYLSYMVAEDKIGIKGTGTLTNFTLANFRKVAFRRLQPRILIIDQDWLDSFSALMCVEHYLVQGDVSYISSAHAVISADGNIDYTDNVSSDSSTKTVEYVGSTDAMGDDTPGAGY